MEVHYERDNNHFLPLRRSCDMIINPSFIILVRKTLARVAVFVDSSLAGSK